MPAGVTVRVVVKSLWLVGDSRCLAAWRVLSFTLISGSSPTSRLRCSGGHARATGGKRAFTDGFVVSLCTGQQTMRQ
jgi:hypothetical protein